MKSIIDRNHSALTVATASYTWAPSTAAALAEFLRPELAEGETLPDLELVQVLFGRALTRRWGRLEATGEAHVSTVARYRLAVAERTAATRALYHAVVDLRTLMRGIFGAAPARRLLGLKGRTSLDPVVLLKQAERAQDQLRDPLPRAAFEPSESDQARWSAPVKTLASTLEAARARASLAGKELEASAADSRRALGDFNAAFTRVAGWLTGTYRAAGRGDRAETVRPSGRRRGLLLVDGRLQTVEPTEKPAAMDPRAVEQSSSRPIDASRHESSVASAQVTANRQRRSA